MRRDMNKVIQTPPRYDRNRGGAKSPFGKIRGHASRRVQIEIDEDGELDEISTTPRHQGMRRAVAEIRGWDRKEFSDLLGPLYKYLGSRVGKPWDKTVSQISAQFPRNGNTIQRHIWVHIDQFVEENCTRQKGGPVLCSDGSELWGGMRYFGAYYVDQYGILCRAPLGKKYVQKPTERTRFLVECAKNVPNSRIVEMPIKLKGIWYNGWFAEADHPSKGLSNIMHGHLYVGESKCLTKVLDIAQAPKEDAAYYETFPPTFP